MNDQPVILVVDDESFLLQSTAELLREYGYDVVSAYEAGMNANMRAELVDEDHLSMTGTIEAPGAESQQINLLIERTADGCQVVKSGE